MSFKVSTPKPFLKYPKTIHLWLKVSTPNFMPVNKRDTYSSVLKVSLPNRGYILAQHLLETIAIYPFLPKTEILKKLLEKELKQHKKIWETRLKYYKQISKSSSGIKEKVENILQTKKKIPMIVKQKNKIRSYIQ